MTAGYQITYLQHHEIDTSKWDACINNAPNGLIYACSYYLDCMAPGWAALVLDDYKTVMPLPVRKKMGIAYLFQPSLTPVLGIFGNNIDAALVQSFLNAIPSFFKLWDISLNHLNTVTAASFHVFRRNNFVLSLQDTYDNIRRRYHSNARRNISKAVRNGCVITKEISFDKVVAICQKTFPAFTNVEKGLFEKLAAVHNHYSHQAQTIGVINGNGELLSACTFLFSGQRAYYWLPGNTPAARAYGSSALLLDAFIREHAGRELILDFEGSDDAGVAAFYKTFNAYAEYYTTIYYNRLSIPLRWLKPVPALYKKIT